MQWYAVVEEFGHLIKNVGWVSGSPIKVMWHPQIKMAYKYLIFIEIIGPVSGRFFHDMKSTKY